MFHPLQAWIETGVGNLQLMRNGGLEDSSVSVGSSLQSFSATDDESKSTEATFLYIQMEYCPRYEVTAVLYVFVRAADSNPFFQFHDVVLHYYVVLIKTACDGNVYNYAAELYEKCLIHTLVLSTRRRFGECFDNS